MDRSTVVEDDRGWRCPRLRHDHARDPMTDDVHPQRTTGLHVAWRRSETDWSAPRWGEGTRTSGVLLGVQDPRCRRPPGTSTAGGPDRVSAERRRGSGPSTRSSTASAPHRFRRQGPGGAFNPTATDRIGTRRRSRPARCAGPPPGRGRGGRHDQTDQASGAGEVVRHGARCAPSAGGRTASTLPPACPDRGPVTGAPAIAGIVGPLAPRSSQLGIHPYVAATNADFLVRNPFGEVGRPGRR